MSQRNGKIQSIAFSVLQSIVMTVSHRLLAAQRQTCACFSGEDL
jgi:hypothetical protein